MLAGVAACGMAGMAGWMGQGWDMMNRPPHAIPPTTPALLARTFAPLHPARISPFLHATPPAIFPTSPKLPPFYLPNIPPATTTTPSPTPFFPSWLPTNTLPCLPHLLPLTLLALLPRFPTTTDWVAPRHFCRAVRHSRTLCLTAYFRARALHTRAFPRTRQPLP